MFKLTSIFILLLTAYTKLYGQAIFNINQYNGITSNHVYCTLVDKNNYLWIGTTDGLYRYNGYTLVKYDYTKKLPNIDIWSLSEDSSGRIWPLSISYSLGYIKNNVYKSIYKKPGSDLTEIYTTRLYHTGGKTLFVNSKKGAKGDNVEIGVIENDTLNEYILLDNKENELKNLSTFYFFDNSIARIIDSVIYKYPIDSISENFSLDNANATTLKFNYNVLSELYSEPICQPYENTYHVYYKPQNNRINILNINTGALRRVYMDSIFHNNSEKVLFCYVTQGLFYCITSNYIFSIDKQLNISNPIKTSDFFNNSSLNGISNTYYINSPFWGHILATNNKGLFIKNERQIPFNKHPEKLSNYHYMNAATDSSGYWWNEHDKTLSVVTDKTITPVAKLNNIYHARKIINGEGKKLLISNMGTVWLTNDHKVVSLTEGFDQLVANNKTDSISTKEPGQFYYVMDYIIDALIKDSTIYALGGPSIGSYTLSFDYTNKKILLNNTDDKRYNGLAYCKANNLILYYSKDKLVFYNPTSKKSIPYNQKQLALLNILGIDKIFVADNGNLIIKDYNSIHVLNMSTGRHSKIFKNYVLTNSFISYDNGIISVAGGFGVAKAMLDSSGSIQNLETFPNIKNTQYKSIYDVQFSKNYVLLSTDKGAYTINTTHSISADSNLYSVILFTPHQANKLSHDDTFTIEQAVNAISADVIKPDGAGELSIDYTIDNIHYNNTGNQLILPSLSPGSYTTVTLVASDESWRSKPISFTIYIKPYWWQTTFAKRVIFLLIALLSIGVIYLVILITKRIVNKSNNRRIQRRELELKSIYSQINPHFIFNTLSTAQYFVKKNQNKEAFDHISQFSDLLRAYIKSSRNKYITIEEEIENLKNYLHLQLNRFEEKFEYNIHVDESINANEVKIPSLLLQPIVENALNHGIFHMQGVGFLNISFSKDNNDINTLVCTIDDNGIGRKRSKEMKREMTRKADSYGTILIKELISAFNKYEKIKIDIEYIDKELPETGTTVVIRIKNNSYA